MNNVKKYKFVSSVAIAIAVVLVIVVNVFVSVLNNKLPLKIDLTSNKMYELSDKTKSILKIMILLLIYTFLPVNRNKTEIFVRCLINMPPQMKISMSQILI